MVRTVPDTQANRHAFGRASAGPRAEAAFPQVRCVPLVEAGTHAQIAFPTRGIRAKGGEQGRVPSLCRQVEAGMLLMWDSGFYSYRLWHQAVATGAELLVRWSSTLTLPGIGTLPEGSYLSRVYRTSQERARDQNGTWVRVLRCAHNDPQGVLCGKEHRLLTTLLDPGIHPAMDLISRYHPGWEIALVTDEQQTHQAPRMAGRESQVRSETPRGVIQELYGLSLGHYRTRAFMAEAAHSEGLDPDQRSFLGCVRILRIRLPERAAVRGEQREEWFGALLKEMAGERTEARRNRINPRVIKGKMCNFKKKRPEQRDIPPLTQTFEEAVIILY